MGFFSRPQEIFRDDVPVNVEMELADIENVLRISEQDENLNTITSNFENLVKGVKTSAQIGGMQTEDWRLIGRDAELASEAAAAFGYKISKEVFMALAETVAV